MELSELHVVAMMVAAASRELLKREWLLEAMTQVSECTHNVKQDGAQIGSVIEVEEALSDLKLGQVVGVNEDLIGIVIENNQALWKIAVLSDRTHPIYHRHDTFKFTPDVSKQYLGANIFTDSQVGETTFGRFLENVIVLQYPFNFKYFPYQNNVWKPDDIVGLVSKELIRKGSQMTVDEYRTFVDYLFYLNHITEICVPSMTEHSLMTHPDVPKVKKEFIEAHKGQMNDPLVIKELEDKLIALDKEWLGDDPSVDFFKGLGSKSFNIHRKKLFLTTGGIPAFDTETGKMDFIPNSLAEGWTKEALPSIANEIRKGSYERGIETAKGGAETKLVMRVFQDLAVDMDDCGTTRTIPMDFGSTYRIKDFLGRTIRWGNQDIVLTEENIGKYDGRVLQVYSPLTCAHKGNLCFKCCGQRAKELGATVIGIQVVKITSKFMNQAMKNMHGTELKVNNVKLEDILL